MLHDSAKILVVEDDRDLSRALRQRLRANGYETVSAADGLSASSLVNRELPDLVILDLGLPGADGFSVLAELQKKARLAGIPVLVLTAWDAAVCEDRALEAGASIVLQKPASNEVLLDAISLLLEESGNPPLPPRWGSPVTTEDSRS